MKKKVRVFAASSVISATVIAILFHCLSFNTSLRAQEPSGVHTKTVSKDIQQYADPDAYAVYVVLLEGMFQGWAYEENETVLFQEETETNLANVECLSDGKEIGKKFEVLVARLVQLTQASMLLKDEFPMAQPYDFMSGEKLWDQRMKHAKSEQFFFRGYFGYRGYFELSPVAFDRSRRLALVYLAYDCGILCGHSGYFILKKKGGKWRTQEWDVCGLVS